MRNTDAIQITRRQCVGALAGAGLLAIHKSGWAQAAGTVADESWPDAARKRELPIKVRWPDEALHKGERPVVLFSHGLGGTRDGGTLWGEAWVQAGFVVVHLQHPGSDLAAVRAVAVSFNDRSGLRNAASAAQLLARLGDVGFVLDEITRRHAAQQGALGQRAANQDWHERPFVRCPYHPGNGWPALPGVRGHDRAPPGVVHRLFTDAAAGG